MILSLALGLPSNAARAFDQARWVDACERAIKSVDACDLSDVYIEFACARTAKNSQTATQARQEITKTLQPLCKDGKLAQSESNDDGTSASRKTVRANDGSPVTEPMPCVITTACSGLCGLSDDCYELKSLRDFRDRHMVSDPVKSKTAAEYYRRSAEILKQLSHKDDRVRILAKSYAFYILPAALMASAGLDRLCYAHYCRGIRFLQTAAARGR